MTTTVEAIYEDGRLRPLEPLALPEHARVRLSFETVAVADPDLDRAAWLAQSERRLTGVWDNPDDDVYNALLP